MSRRTGIGAAKALVQRLGLEKFAARVGVRETTVKRWLRDGLPASRQDDVREAYERSERARQAAVARAEQAREREASARREAATRARAQREAWRTRRFREGREEILKEHGLVYPNGAAITGHTGRTHIALTAMLRNNDPAWLEFLAMAEGQGRTIREAKAEWYSPSAKKRPRPAGQRKRKNRGKSKGKKNGRKK